ncbi:hypothetical protein EDC01DRAFT_650720 [Geopyxis carbonaria]|nr:hypothetical protein EDC01DRAFT_650720 [Geopyxis carbonaria]
MTTSPVPKSPVESNTVSPSLADDNCLHARPGTTIWILGFHDGVNDAQKKLQLPLIFPIRALNTAKPKPWDESSELAYNSGFDEGFRLAWNEGAKRILKKKTGKLQLMWKKFQDWAKTFKDDIETDQFWRGLLIGMVSMTLVGHVYYGGGI